jgi:hypothetical protein
MNTRHNMAITKTLITRSQKLITDAGGHCGMLPAWEDHPEVWQTVKEPARWIGVGGKTLNAGECRLMREEGTLVRVRTDNLTGAVIYKLAVQS